MARTATFKNKMNIVAALENIRDENTNKVSYYLRRQLVKMEYIETEKVAKTGRGRPAEKVIMTGKGRGYLALSRNWKKEKTATETAPVVEQEVEQVAA